MLNQKLHNVYVPILFSEVERLVAMIQINTFNSLALVSKLIETKNSTILRKQ